MTPESSKMAGILLVVMLTMIAGGVSLLSFLIDPASGYMENPRGEYYELPQLCH